MDWHRLLSSKRLHSDGTTFQGSEDRLRTPFQRDWDRITFSPAFRRLQDKTQVFPLPEDDSVHSRLTHSIEVASVGRSLGTAIGIEVCKRDAKLAESVHPDDFAWIVSSACLAHDIGNPPFGHAGEDAIGNFFRSDATRELLSQKLSVAERMDFENFEGNAQGFRTIVRLQHESDGGFCLTSAVLGAFTKYPREVGPGKEPESQAAWKKHGFAQSEVPLFKALAAELALPQSIERSGRRQWSRHPLAYLVEAADDICYATLDLEDGIRLGLVPLQDETLATLIAIASMNGRFKEKRFAALPTPREKAGYLRAVIIDQLIHECVDTFLANYEAIMAGTFATSLVKEIPHAEQHAGIIAVAKRHCYSSEQVLEIELAGYAAIHGLLDLFVRAAVTDEKARRGELRQAWMLLDRANRVSESDPYSLRVARVVDFVAGMTDRYALVSYRRLRGVALPGRFN